MRRNILLWIFNFYRKQDEDESAQMIQNIPESYVSIELTIGINWLFVIRHVKSVKGNVHWVRVVTGKLMSASTDQHGTMCELCDCLTNIFPVNLERLRDAHWLKI